MYRASRMHTISWSRSGAWPLSTTQRAARRNASGVLHRTRGFHAGAVSSAASSAIQRCIRATAYAVSSVGIAGLSCSSREYDSRRVAPRASGPRHRSWALTRLDSRAEGVARGRLALLESRREPMLALLGRAVRPILGRDRPGGTALLEVVADHGAARPRSPSRRAVRAGRSRASRCRRGSPPAARGGLSGRSCPPGPPDRPP